MDLFDIALDCARRGWHVFPCWPRTKKPMTSNGWHAATVDEAKIRAWWARTPDANVAIACGPSNLAVLDIDHGIPDETLAEGSLVMLGVPSTYIVRTGRRPEFGVQLYFHGAVPDVGLWKLHGCEGQVKSLGGYVMAAGSIHPSGEAYEVWGGGPDEVAETPRWIRELKPERVKIEDGPITGNRNVALTSIAGKLRNAGLSADALRVALLQVNADRCEPPMDESEVERIAANAAKWELPAEAMATLGSQVPVDPSQWRSLFHTREETASTPDPQFLIEGFL